MEGEPMNQAFTAFDPAEHLDSGEAIAVFISDALETGDAAYIAHAMASHGNSCTALSASTVTRR